MKTTLAYVLVSTEKDIYLEQAFVSMYSVRRYMPDAHITVLTDRLTQETLIDGRRHKIAEERSAA